MGGYLVSDTRKVTTHRLIEMKEQGQQIAMLTSYDYTMAQLVDGAGIDIILVGDSASNVMAGNMTTLPITIDQMPCTSSPACLLTMIRWLSSYTTSMSLLPHCCQRQCKVTFFPAICRLMSGKICFLLIMVILPSQPVVRFARIVSET